MSVILDLVVSGEDPILPVYEVESILQGEGIKYSMLSVQPQLLRIEVPDEKRAVADLRERASMVRLILREVASSPPSLQEFTRRITSADWRFLKGKRFEVRILKMGECEVKASSPMIEARIGGLIQALQEADVDLRTPEERIMVVLTKELFALGCLLARIRRGVFKLRGSKMKVFSHSSQLNHVISRLMVNLSRSSKEKIVLDPFCGTGSIPIEAGLVGCTALGTDVSMQMLKGAKANVSRYDLKGFRDFMLADAAHPPFRRASLDSIVTDPPYGRSSTTVGRGREDALKALFTKCVPALKPGSRIVFMYPLGSQTESLMDAGGIEVEKRHEIRVHGSLTRVLVVAKV